MMRIANSSGSIIYLGQRGVEGAEEAAIKVVGEEIAGNPIALERMRIEVEALSRVSNPHVAKLINYSLNDSPAWIATEYLSRTSLETKLKQDGIPVTGIEWWHLAAKIFNGLKAIHSENIIHKDIKPANIMVDEQIVKIIDFGISYVPGHTSKYESDSIEFEGSRLFAAPENFSGKYSTKMDVFSAGVTLAYAARLKSIWNDENPGTLSRDINKGNPDFEGLDDEQIELIKPLLDKYTSTRPSSDIALEKINQYIEYFLKKSPKPIPMKGSSLIYRLVRNNIFRMSTIFGLMMIAILIIGSKNSEIVYLPEQPQTNSPTTQLTEAEKANLALSQSSSAACESAFLNNSRDIEKECLEAANSGDIRSIYYLGRNAKITGNAKEAEKWFLKSAKLNDVASMGALVQIYMDTKQPESYKFWVKKCADSFVQNNDVSRCKLLLGMDLLKGENVQAGLAYLKDSYEYGNGSAATILGYHFNNLKDFENALYWWERAAELDDQTGTDNVILLANKLERTTLVNKWLKISADNGNAKHAWMFSMEFFEKEDYPNAKKYALLGARGGDVNAMGVLGIILWKIDKDISEAKIWLKRAANDNDVNSINLLGDIAREEKIYSEALTWYKKSEKLGDLKGGYYAGIVNLVEYGELIAGCTSLKNVQVNADKLKKLNKFDDSMQEWLLKSNEAALEICE
jgi:serine/threonine protein kinase